MEMTGFILQGEQYSAIIRFTGGQILLTLETNSGPVQWPAENAEKILKTINWRDVEEKDADDLKIIKTLWDMMTCNQNQKS